MYCLSGWIAGISAKHCQAEPLASPILPDESRLILTAHGRTIQMKQLRTLRLCDLCAAALFYCYTFRMCVHWPRLRSCAWQPQPPHQEKQAMIDLGGETLGGYVIEAPIGSDAAGELYRARHIQLGRSAVLMVLERSATTAPGFQERFQDAMRRAAALRHPNIVEIYDFGVQDDYVY